MDVRAADIRPHRPRGLPEARKMISVPRRGQVHRENAVGVLERSGDPCTTVVLEDRNTDQANPVLVGRAVPYSVLEVDPRPERRGDFRIGYGGEGHVPVIDVIVLADRRGPDSIEKIGADGIPQLLLFNKIDRVSESVVERVKKDYPGAQLISAKSGANIEELLLQIDKSLNVPRKYILSFPQTHQKAINYTHNWGRILEKEYVDGFVKMTVEMGSEEIRNLEDYVV